MKALAAVVLVSVMTPCFANSTVAHLTIQRLDNERNKTLSLIRKHLSSGDAYCKPVAQNGYKQFAVAETNLENAINYFHSTVGLTHITAVREYESQISLYEFIADGMRVSGCR